jgi:hypothetical protein
MGVVKELPVRPYINVMELMVAEEVASQMGKLPPRIVKYIKPLEVETYALNRLPSLYASSEKGWQCQYEKASREMHAKVADAVRQAIAAVQIDLLRASTPLDVKTDSESSNMLAQIRKLLKQPNLSWEDVIKRLKAAAIPSGMKPAAPSSTSSNRPPSAPAAASGAEAPLAAGPSHYQPGTYGKTTWQPKRATSSTSSTGSAGGVNPWDDVRYR